MSEIRTAREDDLPEIARIHVLAWHEAYSDLVESEVLSTVTVEARVAAWRQWYEADTQELHVIQQGDEVRGFVRTCPARNRETDWLGEGVYEVRYVLPFGEVID